jgi:3-oxoacyl-(acyl-carrier-protein) synthase
MVLQVLDTDGYIAKKMERRLDKVIKYVLVSGKKALADAGLDWQGDVIKVCVQAQAQSVANACMEWGHNSCRMFTGSVLQQLALVDPV